MSAESILKIAVIGNAGGGKTTLSRKLAQIYDLPPTHVDSIQFIAGMKIRPQNETREILNQISAQTKWLIDGYGPLDLIEKRFQLADRVILIDFPLWRHIWWCSKRQVKSLWSKRRELPEGCDEATLEHTIKLFKTLWRVHKQMRPELLRILGREPLRNKTLIIRTLPEWQRVFREGVAFPTRAD